MWSQRPVFIEPVLLNVPVAGSYRSAAVPLGLLSPPLPTTRTRPSWSSVAVWPRWGVLIEPVLLNVPVAGS